MAGRFVGGMTEMEAGSRQAESGRYSHKIALEEVLQLLLSCRIGQVANVETASLGSAGRGSLVGGGLVIDGGIAQSVGNVINGGLGDLLHRGGSRHGDERFGVDGGWEIGWVESWW